MGYRCHSIHYTWTYAVSLHFLCVREETERKKQVCKVLMNYEGARRAQTREHPSRSETYSKGNKQDWRCCTDEDNNKRGYSASRLRCVQGEKHRERTINILYSLVAFSLDGLFESRVIWTGNFW